MVSIVQLLPKPPEPLDPPLLNSPLLPASKPLEFASPPLILDPLRRLHSQLQLWRLRWLLLHPRFLSSKFSPLAQKTLSPSSLFVEEILLCPGRDWSFRLEASPPSSPVPPKPPDPTPLQFSLTANPSITLSGVILVAFWMVLSYSSPWHALSNDWYCFVYHGNNPAYTRCSPPYTWWLLNPFRKGLMYTFSWILLELTGFSCLGVISFKLKSQSLHLPLYEVAKLFLGIFLPLYEDHVTALCSSTFGLFKYLPILLWHLNRNLLDFTLLPVHRAFLDLCCPLASFTEITFPLYSSFVISDFVGGSVLSKTTEISVSKFMKGSVVANLGIVNCASAAVSISDFSALYVFSNFHSFISFTKLIVVENGGHLRDFKCLSVLNAFILWCYFLDLVVFSVYVAILALLPCNRNICSVYGE